MSTAKARWHTYNQLQTLSAKITDDYRDFKIEEFRPELISIAEEWKLDKEKLTKFSGIPPLVVAAIMGYNDDRSGQSPSRNPNDDHSLPNDTRKLINGLLAWFGPVASDLAQLQPSMTDTGQILIALGPQARDFLEISLSSISQLETKLCNLAKTNKIEVLAEIAVSLARICDHVPAKGLLRSIGSEAMQQEIAGLHAKVEALTEERDRLTTLTDKLTDRPSDIKTAFLQSIGNLPLAAASGTVGMLCGPEHALAMMSYVQTFVATTLSAG